MAAAEEEWGEAEAMEDEHLASSEDEAEAAAGASGDRLLAAIGGLQSQEEPSAAAVAARRRSAQAQAESEFHAGGVDEEVTVEDLLAPMAEGAAFGDVRRQLEGLARSDKLPEPMAEPKRNREERSVQYESTKKDQGKWIPQLQQNRKAEQVVLGEVLDQKPVSTGDLIGTFKPQDDFEKELEELTRAAGATEEDVKGAQVLPVNPRIRDEKQVQQVAKLKALMLREQKTARRVNKIKSKAYRRIHRKAEGREREALMERLETENPELANHLKQEYEKKRAQMRLMRQRNARTKWAKTMQRFAKGDANAQKEITKQAQKAHDERMSLRRAIAGKDPDQDSDSDAVDLSGSEAEGEVGGGRRGVARETISKAKKLTVGELKDLEEGGELPTTGILGMGFMRQAIKKKREAAMKEAQGVLQELEGLDQRLDEAEAGSDDSSEDEGKVAKKAAAAGAMAAAGGGGAARKRKEFTAEELAAARKEVSKLLDDDGDGLACSVSGPLSVKGVKAARVPSREARGGASAGADGASVGAGEAAAASGGIGSAGGSSSSRRGRKGKAAKTLGTPSAAAAAAAAANPWLDAAAGEDAAPAPEPAATAAAAAGDESAAEASAAAAPAAAAPTGPAKPGTKKKGKRKKGGGGDANQAAEEVLGADTADDMLSALNADSAEFREQRELVRTAFVEGTQLEDFDQEMDEKQRTKEEAEAERTKGLVGWGSWTGVGIKAKRPKGKGKGKGAKGTPTEEPTAPAKRKLRVEEGQQKESAKYFVDTVPFGMNVGQYEQKMQMPTGPEWNSYSSHVGKIKPKLFMKVGAIVPPLEYVKHLPDAQRDDAIKTWSASKQPKRLKAKI